MGFIELIGVALASIIGAFFYGKRKGKHDEQRKQDQAYIDTRKRMDEVSVPDDDGVLRDWLRERGKSGGAV